MPPVTKVVTTLSIVLLPFFFFACKKDKKTTGLATLSSISYSGTRCPGYSICLSSVSTGATSYMWAFGDGSTSTDAAPCHTYTDTGNYTIQLTINSDTSLTKTITLSVIRPPDSTGALSGARTWHHSHGLELSGGTNTIYHDADTTFAVSYIDPITLSIGADTLNYEFVLPGTYTFFVKDVTNSSYHETSKELVLIHGIKDTIEYNISDQESAGGIYVNYYISY